MKSTVISLLRRQPDLIRAAGAGIALLLLASMASAPDGPSPLDPSNGVINGKVAIAAMPVLVDIHGKSTILASEGCELHLVNSDDVTVERVYPCGSWFKPPVGRYLFWLEKGSSVSYQSVLYYAGEKFKTSGKVFLKPVYPAGSVQLDAKTDMPAGGTFRILTLDTRERYRPFDRRISSENAKKRVRVPVGRVIASIVDHNGRALSLSRPQRVTTGTTTVISPNRTDVRSTVVLAILDRFVSHLPLPNCNGALVTKTQRRRPDIDMQAYDRIVFAWYAVPALGKVRLEVECGTENLLMRQVRLERGAIETIRSTLRNPRGVATPKRPQITPQP